MTTGLLLLAALLAGLLLAFWLHHLFEGECLPLDLWREWRLSRISLAALDRHWQEAPDRARIVVSLTTIPSRFGSIDDTLKSLLAQTRKPARIVLNVPEFSRREQVPYVVPAHLLGLASLEIRRCEDFGPATKVIPALLAEAADQPVLVVDDDRIYPPAMVAWFEAAAARLPDSALALGGWIVPEDLTDRATTIMANLMMRPPVPIRAPRLSKPRPVDIMLGVMGYLVRPRFFSLEEMIDFSDGPAALRYVDDVRTSALCKADKLVIPASRLGFIPKRRWSFYKDTALANINRGAGGDESRHNTIAIRHFASRWRVGGPARGDAAR